MVDDQETIRLLAREVLEANGFEVVEASGGAEGLALFAERHPDIVLLDVVMPEPDGFAVCAELTEGAEGKNVPVLMMTGLDDVASIHRAYEAGATDFVTKPINWELLSHRVRYMLRASRTVDDLRSKEAALRESERQYLILSQQYLTLFEGIPDPLTVIGPDMKVRWANRAAAEVLGREPAQLVGKACHALWQHRETPCEECHALESFRTGKTGTGHLPSPDGRLWGVRTFPIRDDNGKVGHVIELAHDITEKVRLQTETIRAGQLAALGELAAGVAHEINNPINGIINYAQLLANQAAPESREKEISGRIIKESDRIAVIVRNLLSFARERKERKGPVPVGEILADSLPLVETQLAKDGIRLKVDLPQGLPPVIALKQQIQQVILNLISNARYALNEKYPGAHEEKRLEIAGELFQGPEGPQVRITVLDRGAGIPPEILDRVMNPFFSTKPHDKGTGLGLSISHGIVKDHDGLLRLESRKGDYTRAVLELPAFAPAGGRR